MEPDSIQTEYSLSECAAMRATELDGSRTCIRYGTLTRETAPFVPNFTYNYQVFSDDVKCQNVLVSLFHYFFGIVHLSSVGSVHTSFHNRILYPASFTFLPYIHVERPKIWTIT